MPFDVLPRHDIKFPQVQFYHPSPALAEIALEGSRMRYNAMMQAMDSIVKASDPVNIADRRMKIAEANYERDYGMPNKIMEAQFQQEFGIPLQEAQARAQKAQFDFQVERIRRLNAASAAANGPVNAPASPGTQVPNAQIQNAVTQTAPFANTEAGQLTTGIPGQGSQPSVAPWSPAVTPSDEDEENAANSSQSPSTAST